MLKPILTGSPVCAAAEEGTKAPARSAEVAKRAPDTASKYGRILKSSSIYNLTVRPRLTTAVVTININPFSRLFDKNYIPRRRQLDPSHTLRYVTALGLNIPPNTAGAVRADEVIE